MLNGVKALGTRYDDVKAPWWLILIPAALVTALFLVTTLLFLPRAPVPFHSSVPDAEVESDALAHRPPDSRP